MNEESDSTDTNVELNSEQDASIDAAEVVGVEVDEEMEQSYIDYAMSVIAGRALPDVRDGLKPVNRRILYSMYEEGIKSTKSHRKSSSVVGETMGNFHPHGDSSIYDSLVRMAQEFSMRSTLVDGQGNFGSIDGDPAAAMRYTESRMSPLAEEMLEDIEKETVNFEPNYDGRIQEPTVLPSKVPNLLLNGSQGIAVGMSTKIPPHNLNEIADGLIHLLDNPEASVDELMKYIPGPDFPTGGKIIGTEGIENAYKTGKGKIRIRADYEIVSDDDGEHIIISELPYQSNKSRIVENIAEMVKEDRITGIKDLRDESDQDGIRVVIDIKFNSIAEVVANKLVETVLEKTFGIILLALVDGQPNILSLKDILQEYIKHRVEVIRRRSQYDLDAAEDRAHILEGRLKALENIDSVIEIIQDSDTRSIAISNLQEHHELTEPQANHIVKMQLGSLTSLEEQDVKSEYEDLQEEIEYLTNLLDSREMINDVIKQELRELKDEYDMERKTEILQGDEAATVEEIDLIAEEDCFVFVSEEGYIKRVSPSEISEQHRNGKGVNCINLKSGDNLKTVLCGNTHETVYFFSNTGKIYSKPLYKLPEQSRTSRGKPLVTLLNLDDDEFITSITTGKESEENNFIFVTANGKIKKTNTNVFDNIYDSGLIAINLEEDDSLVDVKNVSQDRDSVFINTENGKMIRFDLTTVRETGRNTKGVNGIKLDDDNSVVAVATADSDTENTTVLSVTKNGFGKQTELENYREQSRYGKGSYDINTGSRNGPVVETDSVEEIKTLLVGTKDGKVLRTTTDEIATVGKNAKGVGVIKLNPEDTVCSIAICE